MTQNWKWVGSARKGERCADALWWRRSRYEGSEAPNLLIALALVGCSAASAWPAVSIRNCYDGDTCTTTTGEKVRLVCIDTPELRGRNFDPVPARGARDYLRNYLKGKAITIRRIDTDRYGRTVAELFADEANFKKQLVTSGHAEICRRYAKPCAWANS